jgi:hypothetical protein
MRFSDKHTTRNKHLLRLERELTRLRKAQWNAPIIPLEHPYQRGWVKTFKLREDALHHPEVKIFQAVLLVVNQKVTSRHRGFIHKNGGQHVLRPRIIPVHEWARRPWPFSHQRLFAYGQWDLEDIYPCTTSRQRNSIRGFRLLRTWWLDEIVGPLMITHQRVDLPEVRSRIAEIEIHFRSRLGWARLHRLHGRHARWHCGPAAPAVQRAEVDCVEQYGASGT